MESLEQKIGERIDELCFRPRCGPFQKLLPELSQKLLKGNEAQRPTGT
jgi:hypothetical protein